MPQSANGAGCTDNEPRIIELDSTINLSDTEGTGQAQGCFATTVCTGGVKSEITLMAYDWQKGYCTNKPTSTYRYKVAGLAGVPVGSNKTVVGAGRNAGIVRNLSIGNINEGMVWGGDALTISNAQRVWIDHNRFARRMFLVTGTGDKALLKRFKLFGPSKNVFIDDHRQELSAARVTQRHGDERHRRATGPWWNDYMYSIESSGSTDKPQMSVLQPYLAN